MLYSELGVLPPLTADEREQQRALGRERSSEPPPKPRRRDTPTLTIADVDARIVPAIEQAIDSARDIQCEALGEIIAELEYKIEHAPPGPQGAQGIPGSSGKLPLVKSWQSGTVFYEGDVVMHAGCAFQAQRDTAKPLEHSDWRCIAAAGQDGRSIRVRGTWDTAAAYQLTVLNDRERRIFEARRLADKPATLEALAGEFGISRERIRQIEVRAFQKVQKAATSAISSRERPVGKRTSMSAAA